jgi:hypothetical protein
MAMRQWTLEQRARQSAAIHDWQPWQYSTGARTSAGKAIVSKNSYRGGIRPFLRFINLFYKESEHIETMTLERMDVLEARCTKLCDEFHSWQTEVNAKIRKSAHKKQ